MELPSERFRRGDPRPIGFQSDLSPAHVAATITALGEIAEAVTMPDDGRRPRLRVCLTSAALMPGLPFTLYGFVVHAVDSDGRVITDAATDELRYVVTANQPVDLQRETAITAFFQLVGRQALVTEALEDRATFSALPDRAGLTDDEHMKAAGSELRGNWRAAIASLHAEAAALGVSIEARYEPDPLPSRDDVMRRLPAVRRAYNELALSRDAIDRAAGALAGQPWRITGGDEQVRRFVQERVETMQLTRYISQAARDAYVCGNGYIGFGPAAEDLHLRTLRPEAVEVRGERFIERTTEGERDVTDGLVPLKGIQQLRSPYGMSALELALSALRTHDHLEEIRERAGQLRRRGLLVEQLRTLEEDEELAERMFVGALEDLRPVFAFFLEEVPAPPPDLYFPGQERIS